jgi:putative ABC transport system ATP-binding protein/lipoprotein-releasing system ATP-binding protein
MTQVLASCEGAGRTFGQGHAATVAVQPATCFVPAGARIAIVGPSGSGKSTLLHMLAGLDDPTVGTVSWPGIGTRRELRPGPVAVVFQGPSLLAPLTVAENVALPLLLADTDEREATERALAALDRLGLAELADKLPEEISGGQAQRVAVARALAGEPVLILADEPTGQLDHENAHAVVDVLLAAGDRAGAAVLVATHDLEVADRFRDRWEMHSGRLTIRETAASS